MSVSATSDVASPRYHGLDVVRSAALFLGVALHATLSFVRPQVWLVADPETLPALSLFFFVVHMFRMSLFFALSGFFGRLLFKKLGAAGFIANRLRRIASPLLIFWPVVMTAFIVVGILMAVQNPHALTPPPPMTAQTFPLTHLWFLYVLLLFYPAMLIVRGAVALIDPGERLRDWIGHVFAGVIKADLAAVVFGAPLFIAMLLQTDWLAWFGVPTPDAGFLPNTLALTGFGAAFGFGWLLNRRADLLESLARAWPRHLISAVLLSAYCLSTVGPDISIVKVAGIHMILYAAAYVLAAWSWLLAIIGFAQRHLNGGNPFWRYLADSSYWIYIVHLPLVLLLGYGVSLVNCAPEVKYVFVLNVTLAVGLSSYALFVRHSLIGKLLNGSREKPAGKGKPHG